MRKLLTSTATFAFIGIVGSVGCGSGNVDGISTGGAGGTGLDGGSFDASTGGTGGSGGAGGAGGGGGACLPRGSACTSPLDCCTLVCDAGACGASQCTPDSQPCANASQCCSGMCNASGACTPLNPACRTTGNACTAHADCCSKLCNGGVCASGSFCTQNGDVCAANSECCGGVCSKGQGATVGICTQSNPPGTTGCAVAGQACGGAVVVDGGGNGGIPECGGECCSRACAPHRSGLLVCQPPSGCRPTGEICNTDTDCCGGVGSAQATGVHCSKANPADPVGRCDNGNSCRPAGAVCKLAGNSCNAENNCCSGNVNQNPFACQQDILGIPRCTMTGQPCNDAGSKVGQPCATSVDCCGLTCVPNPVFTPDGGVPPFVCGGECVGNGGTCTTAADCCPGLPCTLPPGSTHGVCGSPPPRDAGPPPPTDGGKPPCAEYGQTCTTSGDCCNNVPCTGGRCIYIVK